MNCGATTAFLPNFVGFPSPRGLPSSTVQSRRAPPSDGVRPLPRPTGTGPLSAAQRRSGARPGADPAVADAQSPEVEAGCPVSAASPTASATAPAGRPASAGRATSAGRSSAGTRRATGTPVASAATRPPAVTAPAAATARTARARPSRAAADRGQDEQCEEYEQDDAEGHDATPPSESPVIPRSGPPWAPRSRA